MRLSLALVVLLVVLSGCQVGHTPVGEATPDSSPTPETVPSETSTPTSTDDGRDTDDNADEAVRPPDPAADRLGWENGVWANETLRLNRSDGLNESELEMLVARTMARVEVIRGLEFEKTVPVRIISREEFSADTSSDAGYPESFRQFDNAKFEALLLIGEDSDSIEVQNTNRGQSVLGFYSPGNEEIVIVAENDTASLSRETVLAHELAHALQDQRFDLSSIDRNTREQYAAANGIIEGDTHYVESQYAERCEAEWDCLEGESSAGGGGDFHFGVYFLNFFPYSDGPPFIDYHQTRGGWSRIDAMYAEPPASSEQVIFPEKYGEDEPDDVALADRHRNGWERVRPASTQRGLTRPNYARLGQASLSTMFAYTLYDDYNPDDAVIRPDEFLNLDAGGEVNRSDPLDYALEETNGWGGDRMHVYRKDGELGYVWKITWDSPADAREFARGYDDLLAHWGATRTSGETSPRTYHIDDGPFADAFRVYVYDNTTVIVNAPTESDLRDVWRQEDGA